MKNCFTKIWMYGFFSILSVLSVAFPAFAQEQQFMAKGVDPLPSEIQHQIKIDAARLALRQVADLNHAPIEIYNKSFILIYDLLKKVYTDNEVGKSIVHCGVQTASNPPVNYLKIVYDRSVDWAVPIEQGDGITKNNTINKLLDKYELVIEATAVVDNGTGLFTLRSVEPVNMVALANELSGIPGILKLNFDPEMVSNSDISMEQDGNGWRVVYQLKFKEEQADQIHQWVFHVSASGSVMLLSESGAPIPSWMCGG